MSQPSKNKVVVDTLANELHNNFPVFVPETTFCECGYMVREEDEFYCCRCGDELPEYERVLSEKMTSFILKSFDKTVRALVEAGYELKGKAWKKRKIVPYDSFKK